MQPDPHGMPAWWRLRHGSFFRWTCACDGAARAIRYAADPSIHLSMPYTANPHYTRIDEAVRLAKLLMRDARRRGIYPTTQQLEAELRLAA